MLLSLAAAGVLVLLLVRKSWMPVLGRRTRGAVLSPAGLAPDDHTYQPRIFNRAIAIDSSQNPHVKLVLFGLLLSMFALIFAALTTNQYSVVTVSAETRAALVKQGSAPEDEIGAGVVGLSGLNPPGGGGGRTYDCASRQSNRNAAPHVQQLEHWMH